MLANRTTIAVKITINRKLVYTLLTQKGHQAPNDKYFFSDFPRMVQKKITDGNFTMCRNPKGHVKTVKRFLYKSEDLVSFTVSIVSILQLSHKMYQRDEDMRQDQTILLSHKQTPKSNLRIKKEVKEERHT